MTPESKGMARQIEYFFKVEIVKATKSHGNSLKEFLKYLSAFHRGLSLAVLSSSYIPRQFEKPGPVIASQHPAAKLKIAPRCCYKSRRVKSV